MVRRCQTIRVFFVTGRTNCTAFVAAMAWTLALFTGPAHANDPRGDAWTLEAVSTVLRLQYDPACFSDRSTQRHVHVLGISPERTLVTETQASELLGKLSRRLRNQTPNRITIAPTFQFIASATPSKGARAGARLRKLLGETVTADVTVLLRPLSKARGTLFMELIIWANDKAANDSFRCTISSNFQIDLQPFEDPACATAFGKIGARGSREDYVGFIRFFEHCPQVADATSRLKQLEARACSERWGEIGAANDAATFQDFATQNPNCQEAKAARILARTLRTRENAREIFTERKTNQTARAPDQTGESRTYGSRAPNAQARDPQASTARRTRPADTADQIRARVRDYIEWQYLKDKERFDDYVDYYAKGVISRAAVLKDKRKYTRRWPNRSYVLDPGSLDIERVGRNEVQATFGFSYRLSNSQKTASGSGRIRVRLKRSASGFLVTGVREALARNE